MAERPNRFPVNPEWLARRREQPIEPDLAIVDPHVHLWRRHDDYFVEHAAADVAGHNVQATVFIQCRTMYREDGPEHLRPVGETEFAARMAAASERGPTRFCAGIVAFVDLRGDAVDDVLQAHAHAGDGRLRGVRQSLTRGAHGAALGNPSPADPAFLAGLARLAKFGLSFDALLHFTQLDDLACLADRFPDTTFVLNHFGGVLGDGDYAGKQDEVFAAWRMGITALARRPNVVMKLGGLGMPECGFAFGARTEPPSSEDLANAWRPYVETSIAAFGPQRCMFESNFPVDKTSCSYVCLWNAFKRIAAGYSADEKAALFHGVAASTYRLAL